MKSSVAVLGLSIVSSALISALPASAACRDITLSAEGVAATKVEDAKSSAGVALVSKIGRVYGKPWSVGSHRNGSFHCDKHLGYRAQWICSAKTTVICRP